MTKNPAKKSELKQKAKHELKEILMLFLYLAFFFCALTTYNMILLRDFEGQYWSYSFALINALVVTKVILIGEAVKVGTRYETRPLLLSAIYKAFIFWGLVLAFHFVEELIKRMIHGADLSGATREIRIDELLGRSIIVFCVFVPLFAFREFRRVLSEEKFDDILFRSEGSRR